jgi:hypothetical protein
MHSTQYASSQERLDYQFEHTTSGNVEICILGDIILHTLSIEKNTNLPGMQLYPCGIVYAAIKHVVR